MESGGLSWALRRQTRAGQPGTLHPVFLLLLEEGAGHINALLLAAPRVHPAAPRAADLIHWRGHLVR